MTSIAMLAIGTLWRETLPEFENELRIRQVIDLHKQTPIHVIGNLGNGVLLAWMFWHRLPHAAVIVWLGAFALFSGFSLWRWWVKRSWPQPNTVSRGALRRSTAWASFVGLMWAVAVVSTFPRQDPTLQLLILFLVGGLGAGAVASTAAQPVGCIAFVAPPMIAVLTLLWAENGSPVTHVIAAMGVLYFFVLMAALLIGFSSFVTIVRNRIDSRSLETRLLQAELAASADSNRAKSMFLANMSHELRTPLNAIIGFSEIIRDQPVTVEAAARCRDYANDINDAGQHLLKILSAVLDFSRIEAGRLVLDEDEVDVAAVVAAALKLVAPLAREAGVALSAELPPLPLVRADELRVRQILLNLLSNAIKFSRRHAGLDGAASVVAVHPASAVVGGALRADGSLALWVSDNGIGMTPAEIAVARQPFRQVEMAFNRRHEGAGLGLSLVDGFMSLHGGSLDIASTPSVGTTVTIIFPPERVLLLRPLKAQAV